MPPFLSTLSLRRATLRPQNGKKQHNNFYPRSPCGERQCGRAGSICHADISIHALLAESDPDQPRGLVPARQFLSTLSLRRATARSLFSIHFYKISIHALLAESDGRPKTLKSRRMVFLSTLSLRRATARRESRQQPAGISIHALLAESDVTRVARTPTTVISIHALLAESDSKSAQNSGALLRI
mgnify:CR=1 FL=1